MKYYPKLNLYKASNLSYNPETEEAYSYKWYCLARRYGDLMVVNRYNYSSTTIKHLYKIRKLFDSLDIQYIEIEAPHGLKDLVMAEKHYLGKIDYLEKKIANPRSRKSTNEERELEIANLLGQIDFIQELRGQL